MFELLVRTVPHSLIDSEIRHQYSYLLGCPFGLVKIA